MTDSVPRPCWVIPSDPNDMAPLPALLNDLTYETALWSRRDRVFKRAGCDLLSGTYDSFEDCRSAMIRARTDALNEARGHARVLAAQIEHIRTIPPATFPNVIREAPQEEAPQEEAKTEEAVTHKPEAEPAKGGARPALKRPLRSK
jgi:hypothetical protein